MESKFLLFLYVQGISEVLCAHVLMIGRQHRTRTIRALFRTRYTESVIISLAGLLGRHAWTSVSIFRALATLVEDTMEDLAALWAGSKVDYENPIADERTPPIQTYLKQN